MLCNLREGDEVLVQSFTFSSSALPFINSKAKIRFLDSMASNIPYVSLNTIKNNLNKNVRVVVINHYAGISTPEIVEIKKFTTENNIILLEDNAHGIGSKHENKLLGTFGDFGVISFHDTKNITAGEGGLLITNKNKENVESCINKGTNYNSNLARKNGFYEMVSPGGSFGISELNCALLNAQLEEFDLIQKKRMNQWNFYFNYFKDIIKEENMPFLHSKANHNAGFFYLFANDLKHRDKIIENSKKNNFMSSFHYYPLDLSVLGKEVMQGSSCVNAHLNYERIVRLPLFFNLNEYQQEFICSIIKKCY